MLFHKMRPDLLELITMHVYELSALLALAVEAHMILVVDITNELEARGTVKVDRVFVKHTLINEVFKLPVNCGLADRGSVLLHVFADISSRDVPLHPIEKLNKEIPLLGFVL